MEELQRELISLLKDVIQVDDTSIEQMHVDKCVTTNHSIYHQGRHEVSYFVKMRLLNIISLLPIQEMKYYTLKETDNIDEILEEVNNGQSK